MVLLVNEFTCLTAYPLFVDRIRSDAAIGIVLPHNVSATMHYNQTKNINFPHNADDFCPDTPSSFSLIIIQ
ncbi:hypothetical protein BIY29_11020 [Brenneria alni]|uniref:Uncharacterized protein n=1 Tax=Brenneria alni TaxID=71656 RepID=A0A421DNG7_9GAMM|nr:hypothetical protein BIY29_11020 [Brenneria alni]